MAFFWITGLEYVTTGTRNKIKGPGEQIKAVNSVEESLKKSQKKYPKERDKVVPHRIKPYA